MWLDNSRAQKNVVSPYAKPKTYLLPKHWAKRLAGPLAIRSLTPSGAIPTPVQCS